MEVILLVLLIVDGIIMFPIAIPPLFVPHVEVILPLEISLFLIKKALALDKSSATKALVVQSNNWNVGETTPLTWVKESELIDGQYLKAPLPIEVKVFGKVIEVREEQLSKA